MSAALSGPSGLLDYGAGARVAGESARIRQRLDALTEQSATGRVADTYAGLGGGARVSLDLRPQIAQATAYSADIDAAAGRMGATQDALSQLGAIASNFAAIATNPAALTAGGMASTAAQARDAMAQVASLLNTQIGGTYVFAGQDSANPPVPDAALAAFSGQVQADVAGLGTSGAAATVAATKADAAAPATSPFSATLGTAPPTVDAGEGVRVPVGVLANQPYVADLLRGLATLGSLTQSQAQSGQPFLDMLGEARSALQGAGEAIGTESGLLGARQAQLTTAKTQLSDTADALTRQVSGAEDVDMAATATALSQTQTQLQASYQVLVHLQTLSLVNFMGGG